MATPMQGSAQCIGAVHTIANALRLLARGRSISPEVRSLLGDLQGEAPVHDSAWGISGHAG